MAYDPKTAIEDMIRAAYGPIIVIDEGWGETIAAWVKEEVRMARMTQILAASRANKRPEEATDVEAMVYLSTASSVAPMSHDWAEIQLWLGRNVMPDRLPKELVRTAPKELTSDQRRQLEDLKRWIWNSRLKSRR